MGDWIYYISFMKMKDVAERVRPAQEIHPGKTLNDFIQRRLKNRASQIKDYLLNQPQRFFNTLVVGVYEGNPEWFEIGITDNDLLKSDDMPFYVNGAVGYLQLRGDEILFALDGQHRVEGIKSAVKQESAIGDEEVGVIFVGHKNSPEGLERTRRLFTTLNRYAKPVSKKDAIALDEDDVVAIVTRRLVDEHPLFHEKISLVESKNLPKTDGQNFTTIVTLYDAMDIYLKPKSKGWADYKKKRPSDSEISAYYKESTAYLKVLLENFDWLSDFTSRKPSSDIAAKYRNDQGGYLLFRPIGFLLITQLVKSLVNSGKTLEKSGKLVAKLPMLLNKDPWDGLLWDSVNRRMITSPTNQSAARKLAFYLCGGNLQNMYKIDPEKLIQELAGLMNKEVKHFRLLLPK